MRAKLATGALALFVFLGCKDPCINTLLSESHSPGDERKAYVFLRNCGATNNYALMVSVLARAEPSPVGEGNVFQAASFSDCLGKLQANVEWIESNRLAIKYDRHICVLKQQVQINGLTIDYQPQDW